MVILARSQKSMIKLSCSFFTKARNSRSRCRKKSVHLCSNLHSPCSSARILFCHPDRIHPQAQISPFY